MSKRNGDRARFQKNRKRKLQHRQRIQALAAGLVKSTGEKTPATTSGRRRIGAAAAGPSAASAAMQNEGGPTRTGD